MSGNSINNESIITPRSVELVGKFKIIFLNTVFWLVVSKLWMPEKKFLLIRKKTRLPFWKIKKNCWLIGGHP